MPSGQHIFVIPVLSCVFCSDKFTRGQWMRQTMIETSKRALSDSAECNMFYVISEDGLNVVG